MIRALKIPTSPSSLLQTKSRPLDAILSLRKAKVNLGPVIDAIFPLVTFNDSSWRNHVTSLMQTKDLLQLGINAVKNLKIEYKNQGRVLDKLEDVTAAIRFFVKLNVLYKILYANLSTPDSGLEHLLKLQDYFKNNFVKNFGTNVSNHLDESIKSLLECLKKYPKTCIATKCTTLLLESIREILRAMRLDTVDKALRVLNIFFNGCILKDVLTAWLSIKRLDFLPSPLVNMTMIFSLSSHTKKLKLYLFKLFL